MINQLLQKNRDSSVKNMGVNQSLIYMKKKAIEDEMINNKSTGNKSRGKTIQMKQQQQKVHSDESGSDYDEYLVHQEGNEEIHITGKARKQLKYPLFSFY